MIAVFVHQAGEHGQQRRLDAVTVVDVQMVPAAFRRELLHVHAYLGVRLALDQPGALDVRRVVAETVVDAPTPLRQSAEWIMAKMFPILFRFFFYYESRRL